MSSFDLAPDRLAWFSLKWARYRDRDVIPMWVADMDFAVSPAIRDALEAHVRSGVLGYTLPPPDLPEIIQHYVHAHHGWSFDRDDLVWLPNLVAGINLAVRAAVAPGYGVATFVPIYPPFLEAPGVQNRELVALPLVADEMHYRIDFAALEAGLKENTRLLLLCNPHNPVGRVWSRGELDRLAEIVLRRNLVVCSDEVHCDLVLDDEKRHIPFASLGREIAARTITLMSPSKTFNIAGLGAAFAVIGDASLRQRWHHEMRRLVPEVNALGYTAMRAAFSDTDDWRRSLITYLRENRDIVAAALHDAGLPATVVEATFLTWIDARSIPDAHSRFEQAGVGLSDGAAFGAPGYLRLNFGCPRNLLTTAMSRVRKDFCG